MSSRVAQAGELPSRKAPSHHHPAQPGHVYLAGAGPGSPELLTLRALYLLETATQIFPDDLVSPEILAFANPHASITPVGKRCGNARVTQSEINALLVSAARKGEIVLRLKAGDPLIFGRIAEEIAALQAAYLPFEIVPGITAASAAAASIGVPLTDRQSSSRVIFTTAHHAEHKSDVDLDPQMFSLGASPEGSTLVIYMPGRDISALAGTLQRGGLSPDTPVVAVSCVSTPHQRVHRSTLAALRSEECGPAPLLLLLGRALGNAAT